MCAGGRGASLAFLAPLGRITLCPLIQYHVYFGRPRLHPGMCLLSLWRVVDRPGLLAQPRSGGAPHCGVHGLFLMPAHPPR